MRRMDRRRLAIATYVAESGRPLTLIIGVAMFLAVVGLALLAATQLPTGVRTSFVAALSGTFIVPFSYKVFQIYRAMRQPDFKAHSVGVDRAVGGRLYALVEETARALGVRAPSGIRMTMTFEYTVVARRDGYELVLGIGLLDALSPTELRALLATVIARHFTGDRLTARAFRCAARWATVLSSGVGSPNAGGANGAAVIAAGYMRLLDVEALASDREAHGREAARAVATPRDLESALARASIYASYAEEVFWPALIARHAGNEQPPDGISQLRVMCRTALPPEEWRRRLNRATAELKLFVDTIAAQEADLARAHASDLVETAPHLTRAFDQAWRIAIAETWSNVHRFAHADEMELNELERVSAERDLTEPETWRRLELIEARQGAGAALPHLLQWVDTHPSDAQGVFHAGRVALSLNGEHALALLERSGGLDVRYVAEAHRLTAGYLREQGREEEAAKAWERYEAAITDLQDGLTQRAKVATKGSLLPHGLRPHELTQLVDHLRRFPMVESAAIARCETSILPTIPLVLIGVRFKRSWFWWNTDKVGNLLAALAEAPLAAQVMAMNISGVKALTRAPAVTIYRAPHIPRRDTFARWGRRSQVALIAIGVFFVLRASFLNRDCFPDCWLKPEAFFYLVPLIVAVNVLLLTGSPDTPARRAAAFLASVLFISELLFSGWWTLFLPFAVVALFRLPATRRAITWTAGMSLPMLALGMIVGRS
jgi:hypothetical protein